MLRRWAVLLFCMLPFFSGYCQMADSTAVRLDANSGQLFVQNKPFVILGGELGNSSAGTAEQADVILPNLARMHLNTVVMPVAWEQIEPQEGKFDFNILDHWIDVARQQNLHLVLLWFGSWKNAFSEYAPAWVKGDTKRFPRALGADGSPLEILSTFGTETLHCDSVAFARLMAHVRDTDQNRRTVLMIQVENEVGYLGPERDRSSEANNLFAGAVPHELLQKLAEKQLQLSPELAANFQPQGRTWHEVFGEAANEAFMAWRYAGYIDSVAESGKKEYSLPMYVNAQLPAPMERPGEYPSGGPNPYNLDIYRAIATHIDFYSPDIYWPEFEYWVKRYRIRGNPIFIPEAKLEASSYNALYAYGAAKAFGFCPFGIDSLHPSGNPSEPQPAIMQTYAALESLGEMLPKMQAVNQTRGMVLHANSPRAIQTVSLGGYLFQGSLSRSWSSGALLANDGSMLLLEAAPDEFLVIGSGLTVKISRDPDTDAKIAGIASIEQIEKAGPEWQVIARLNGDQSNQGRQLMMDTHDVRIYRLKLYAVPR
jgi:hypothetical protein